MRTDPERWLQRHGDAMYRYALARLGSAEAAEDVVQEALLAAVQAAHTFDGRSSELTWLTGILRHKVYDAIRRASREADWRNALGAAVEGRETCFHRGGWAERQSAWGESDLSPDERAELGRTLWACLDDLPAPMRQVFMLREVDEVPTKAICSMLGVSRDNVWTIMHRAKLRLREHLASRWFAADREGEAP